MLRLLTCERGHFWETGEDRCPQCGAPADALPVLEAQDAPPAAPPPAAEAELLDAKGLPAVAGYEVVEDLGRGPTGMRLYKAKDRAVGRAVLLEVVLAKEDSSQHAWSSLRSQAAALARLVHPGVMQLWEAGERDRRLFYNACEFVEGPTLTQKVANKPLPPAQAVRLVEMLARTIDHAHAASVLHRNLRPDAVRLQPTQMPLKLPDRENQPGAAVYLHSAAFLPRIDGFGLVRRPVEGETADAELYGEQAGFLSPEQAWGRVQELGNATDVWGLGAVLFFLLSGEAPYTGADRAAVLDAIQAGEPAWRHLRRGGDDLEAIVRKAMARTPSRRYTSAGAMADDLRRLLLSLPLSIREPTAGYRFGCWLRRRPAVAALVVTAALGAVGTAGGYLAGSYLGAAASADAAAAALR
ncbi:MAG: serine/threonine protein kinase, partial [Gemmataceae bacterium]